MSRYEVREHLGKWRVRDTREDVVVITTDGQCTWDEAAAGYLSALLEHDHRDLPANRIVVFRLDGSADYGFVIGHLWPPEVVPPPPSAIVLEGVVSFAKRMVECPTCKRKEGEKNHPPGMVFIGWGRGWERCSACGGTQRISAEKA